MKLIKQTLKSILASVGYEISKKTSMENINIPVELSKSEVEIIRYVMDSGYTMTSVSRLVNTLKSCKYVVENNIPGDFVECGVWRGGNGILAKKIFEAMGSDKKVWMFDTFGGMTAPTQYDVNAATKEHAERKYQDTLTDTHSEWCYASIEDVKRNCKVSSLDMDSIKFIKGDVCQTLKDTENLPDKIAVLRLDTDWYESTKVELNVLYPRLSDCGVLIIDDYGHWEGARKAVDEYFESQSFKPLINVVDRTGRTAVKI